MNRGWTSAHLAPVGDDDTLWTVADAARILGPLPGCPDGTPAHVTEARIRGLTLLPSLGLNPQGKRRTSPQGKPGRYARVYRAQDMIELYEMLTTSLGKSSQLAA